jgi:hypothetical protein
MGSGYRSAILGPAVAWICLVAWGLRFANLGLHWSLRDVGMGLVVTSQSYAAYGLGHSLVQITHRLVYGTWGGGLTAKDVFNHHFLVAIPYIFESAL